MNFCASGQLFPFLFSLSLSFSRPFALTSLRRRSILMFLLI